MGAEDADTSQMTLMTNQDSPENDVSTGIPNLPTKSFNGFLFRH